MITKSEEEWLMDEAISEKISHLLIKPVNPSQIFMACKETIEKNKIYNKKVSSQYLKEFQEIESLSINANSFSDWWIIYEMLTKWNLKIDNQSEKSLVEIFKSQFDYNYKPLNSTTTNLDGYQDGYTVQKFEMETTYESDETLFRLSLIHI